MDPPQSQGQTPQTNSATSSSATLTRQVSPSTIFGGVNALMESQDWWLRDQASLAVGFENWGDLEGMGDLSGNGVANGMTGVNDRFFIPGPGANNASTKRGLEEDEWFS